MRTNLILLLALFCIFLTGGLYAQNSPPGIEECRSQAGPSAVEYERKVDREEYRRLMQYYLSEEEKAAVTQYAIQLHIVTMDDGTGGIDAADIRGEIDNFVNPYFADIDVEFVECSPELYHNSTEYYTLGDGGEDPDAAGDAMSAEFNVEDVINIYFVNDPDGACGWARFPWDLPVDYIVIANGCADNQSTLVHELGHYFGLYHTHETFNGTAPESVTRDDTDGCYDCESDGDKLCDTPADPNLSSTADDWPSCAYTGAGTDECGVSYNPAIDNIMSYADKECRTVFTDQQQARMEIFRDDERDYLQTGCPCEKPMALCKDIEVELDEAGNAGITPSDVDNGSTWDCGFGSWSVSQGSFDCADVGSNQVTLTVIDDLGWESTCEATVTVLDVTKPEITAVPKDEIVECDGSGNITAFNDWLAINGAAKAEDACGGVWSNNSTGLSDGCGATGSETVTFTYTDPSGNSASTSATFTVVDHTQPDLTCPEDIHLPECVETASWTVDASDLCGEVTVVSNPPSGSVFPKGTTTVVSVTATDECLNESQCTFEVTRDPDLEVDIGPLETSPLNTCAAGTNAHIVLGYGGGPTCVTMNAVGAGGHGPYTYAWAAPAALPEGSFEDANTASPTFCADFQTEPCVTYTFMVTVTDIHGCTETDAVDVYVVNPVCADGRNPKINVCHRPPGNPLEEHTICIASRAVNTHLSNDEHQDCLGACEDVCVIYSALEGGPTVHKNQAGTDGYSMTVQPNPFRSRTAINFSAGYDTEARLIIVDVSGRAVATLFEGPMAKDTPISVQFGSGDLQPGIYVARLIGEDGGGVNATLLLVK